MKGLDYTAVYLCKCVSIPSEPNTGITFVRTDLPGTPSVKADIRNVTNTMRATTLEEGEAKVFYS